MYHTHASLHAISDEKTGSGKPRYHLVNCSADVRFCAQLVNAKGAQGQEKYRACATHLMCERSGSFRLLLYDNLYYHCCNTPGCNAAARSGFCLGTLIVLALCTLFLRL